MRRIGQSRRHSIRAGRGRVRVIGVFLAIASAVAALAGCSTMPGHPIAAQDKVPFYYAVTDLLTQSVAHYVSSEPGRSSTWDLRATTGGEEIGAVTTGGQRSDALAVGGRTYVKPPATALQNSLPSSVSADSVAGKWLSGNDDLAAAVPAGSWSPRTVGTALLNALDQTGEFPRYGAPIVQIGNDRALEVTTPIGALDVSDTAPYRVLRLTPAAPVTGESATRTTAPAPPTTADDPDPATGSPGAPAPASEPSPITTDFGPIDFVPMSPADIDGTYTDLIAQTQQLSAAVDLGINFDFSQTGNINCSDTSCTVSADVTTSTTSTRKANLSGNVSVSMTSTVTVDSRPAGGCATTGTLPVNIRRASNELLKQYINEAGGSR